MADARLRGRRYTVKMMMRYLETRVWILPFAAVLLLSGCSSAPRQASQEGARSLASEPFDESQLNAYYENLIDEQDPSEEVVRSIDQTVGIYYRSQAELNRFDAELDAALASGRSGKLSDLKSYPKMLAYWDLSSRQQQRVSYVYGRLLEEQAVDQAKNPERFKKARSALAALTKYFKHADGTDRLALNSLGEELKPIFKYFSKKIPRKDFQEMSSALNGILFMETGGVGMFARVQKIREELERKADFTADILDQMNEQLEAQSERIRAQLKELEKSWDRSPQSVGDVIFPSAGSHGTLSGNEYHGQDWSLTFDDGPHSSYSAKVLANLQAHGFHATFFELAENASKLPHVSKSLKNAGMLMANHSYTHAQLPKLSAEKLKHEVVDSTETLTRVFGEKPKYFRCPYGSGLNVSRVRQMIADQGMIHVFWNVDTLDWQDKNPDSILARAKKQMKLNKHGVILFHDIHPQSVEASRMLMDYMKSTPEIRVRLVSDVVDELNASARSKK